MSRRWRRRSSRARPWTPRYTCERVSSYGVEVGHAGPELAGRVRASGDRLGPERLGRPARGHLGRHDAAQVELEREPVHDGHRRRGRRRHDPERAAVLVVRGRLREELEPAGRSADRMTNGFVAATRRGASPRPRRGPEGARSSSRSASSFGVSVSRAPGGKMPATPSMRPVRSAPVDHQRLRLAWPSSGSGRSTRMAGRRVERAEGRALVVVAPGSSARALAVEGAAAGAVLRHPDAVAVAATVERDRRPEDGRLVGPVGWASARGSASAGAGPAARRSGPGPPRSPSGTERDEQGHAERRQRRRSRGGGGSGRGDRERDASDVLEGRGPKVEGWRSVTRPGHDPTGPPRTHPNDPRQGYPSAMGLRLFLGHGASGTAASMAPFVDGLRARGVDAARDRPAEAQGRGCPPGVPHRGARRRAMSWSGGTRTAAGSPASPRPSPTRPYAALVCFSYPLHPPGGPERTDARIAHWPAIRCPVLLLSGESDPFARIDLLRAVGRRACRTAELVTYPRLGHTLKPVLDDVLDRVAAFLRGAPGATGLIGRARGYLAAQGRAVGRVGGRPVPVAVGVPKAAAPTPVRSDPTRRRSTRSPRRPGRKELHCQSGHAAARRSSSRSSRRPSLLVRHRSAASRSPRTRRVWASS